MVVRVAWGRLHACGTSTTTNDGPGSACVTAGRPVADTAGRDARAVTCLHATEPRRRSIWPPGRAPGPRAAEVDAALYDDRSMVKQLAMRRTVFAFPRELLPAAWGSASARVADQQVRRMAKEMEAAGIAATARLGSRSTSRWSAAVIEPTGR